MSAYDLARAFGVPSQRRFRAAATVTQDGGDMVNAPRRGRGPRTERQLIQGKRGRHSHAAEPFDERPAVGSEQANRVAAQD
jgi:hypothetical protein